MTARVYAQSEGLINLAKQYIPGGVNSPVRSFNAVGGTPVFFNHAKGAYLYDEDGNEYLDYVGSWGPMILGHQDPDVIGALHVAIDKALSFGAPTKIELEIAQKICALMPNIDMVRMQNSGTEATMTAIRLARGYTGRDLLIKFEGCYHGHSDSLLIKAGSGALTFGQTSSAGVPEDLAKHTLCLPYNNLQALSDAFGAYGSRIAAVIIEPVAGNMGCIPPITGFLQHLRALCTQHQSVLIFDEVMTGFRVNLGGAQAYYDIQPDLTTLGKIIGGGMPVGAVGGKKEIMSYLAPLGPVYQAGTLSGNPIAMTAGLSTLNKLTQPGFYENLHTTTQTLATGLLAAAKRTDTPLQVNYVPGMISLFFSDKPVQNLADAQASHTEKFNAFFHGMLNQGIYLPPSAYETWFVSALHTTVEIEKTLEVVERVLRII
jgi:glutamate-1-semialdehyde 2,1-aminomutase